MTLGQAAGAADACYMARHQDRRKLLMLALVLQLVGSAAIWLPLPLSGIVGDGVWVRSGRRVSALFAAGARSLCATGYCWQAGGVYPGESVLSSPGLPRGFLACCVVSAAIT